MTKYIKLLLCILLIIVLASCLHKRKENEIENKIIVTDQQTTVKSCLITNNFYTDQCVETTNIDYKNINYIELYYKYDIDFNFLEEADINIKTKTILVIEQNNKEIYEEEIEITNYNDIRKEASPYKVEGSTKLYPDILIDKINKYQSKNNIDPSTTNSYIKTTVSLTSKGKIDKTNIVEFIAKEEQGFINVTTNYLLK